MASVRARRRPNGTLSPLQPQPHSKGLTDLPTIDAICTDNNDFSVEENNKFNNNTDDSLFGGNYKAINQMLLFQANQFGY